MTPAPKTIAQWANVRHVGTYRQPIMITNEDTGETYVADPWGPVIWQLQCACGHAWEIEKTEFPGRRKLTYCGRPECTFRPGYKPPRPARQRGVSMSIYLSQESLVWISAYGAKHGLSFSAVVEQAVTGLRVAELLED